MQGDLWVATLGAGRVFNLAGRQARILAVFRLVWGAMFNVTWQLVWF